MQRASDTLVGISVGTTKISVIVAEQNPRFAEGSPEAIQVIGVGHADARGLSKGVIVNLKEATQSVIRAIREAENITNQSINSAIVAFNSLDVESVMTEGMVALDGREPRRVEEADLERAIEAAQSRLELSKNTYSAHTVPVRYELDGRPVDIPLDMTGKRLEIMLQTVSVPLASVQNVITCVEGGAKVKVKGLVLKPLAASLGAVTEEEMRAGCISLTIGGGATGLVLYRDGRPFKIISIPIGGQHITSDLASVLRVSWRDAEAVKKRIFIEDEEALRRDGIDIDMAVQVIGARIEELFMDYVRVALAECSPQLFPSGVILSGGVAKTPGIVEMLEEILQMQVRVALPYYSMPPGREDASYVSAAGILRYLSYRNSDAHLFVEPRTSDMWMPSMYDFEDKDISEREEVTREKLRGFIADFTRKFRDLF